MVTDCLSRLIDHAANSGLIRGLLNDHLSNPVPIWVAKEIGMRRCLFFWVGADCISAKGLCLVAWEKITCLKSDDGLGILNIRDHNSARICSWLWKVMNNYNLYWTRILQQLYGDYRSWNHTTFLRRASPGDDDRWYFLLGRQWYAH
ncbi:hypothetical protein Cni_G13764 [Canna indica]|uniref:Reverse transcriptase zinc-binding domain-containing protein n=1 Tax=Canna indica TaxID=4628 RepID=A0AAQ3QD01_9LILI|nr:hypothetical protein Cni_G13764 [Canna indica]